MPGGWEQVWKEDGEEGFCYPGERLSTLVFPSFPIVGASAERGFPPWAVAGERSLPLAEVDR